MRQVLTKLGLLEERRFPPAQGYTADKSDLYQFDPRDSTLWRASLADGAFTLPAGQALGPSALLKVTVRGSHDHRWSRPWIEFKRPDGRTLRHHLDRGAAGDRFLDVSGLLRDLPPPTEPLRIQVECHQTALEAPLELRVFPQPPAGNRRVLVLGSHPDDAEIAAFGLYRSTKSAVVTITAGDAGRPYYGHIYADPKQGGDLKTRLRLWDSLTVPLWGNVEPDCIANLGYFDGSLQPMRENPALIGTSRSTGRSVITGQRRGFGTRLLREGAESNWRSLVLDLAHVLEVFAPDIVVTPHPFLDAHSDHRFTSLALFEALAHHGGGHGDLWLYSNHPPYCGRWPFGPPTYPSSLAPWPRVPATIRGFHSHPLTIDEQIDKLFALESMHDLRRPPPSITREKEWGLMSSLWEARDALMRSRSGQGTFSYMRRSVRSDEMFFVHPMSDAPGLAESFPDARKQW